MLWLVLLLAYAYAGGSRSNVTTEVGDGWRYALVLAPDGRAAFGLERVGETDKGLMAGYRAECWPSKVEALARVEQLLSMRWRDYIDGVNDPVPVDAGPAINCGAHVAQRLLDTFAGMPRVW